MGFTTTTWMACNIYDSLVRFCVPLLIMISGAIYLNPSRPVTVKSMVTKAIPRMALAFAIWSTLYGLFEFFIMGTISTRRALAEAILLGHYHLWFLFTISGLYLATPILRCIAAKADLTKYFLVCAMLFCFIPFFLLNTGTWVGDTLYAMLGKANLDTFWGYTGYFLLGHFLH